MNQTMMKKIYYLVVVIALTFASCKKDEGVIGNYGASYKAWTNFKSSVNNSYEYAVTSASWTGYGNETIITVRNGKVVQRSFLAKTINGATGAATIVNQWVEDSSKLNTHNEGAATLTMDDVYRKAKAEWLVSNKNTDTYFENNNQGMLSTAGYTEKGCMDDCFNGIKISFIRKITTVI